MVFRDTVQIVSCCLLLLLLLLRCVVPLRSHRRLHFCADEKRTSSSMTTVQQQRPIPPPFPESAARAVPSPPPPPRRRRCSASERAVLLCSCAPPPLAPVSDLASWACLLCGLRLLLINTGRRVDQLLARERPPSAKNHQRCRTPTLPRSHHHLPLTTYQLVELTLARCTLLLSHSLSSSIVTAP